MEMPGRPWRSGIGLAAADADRVVPLSDDRIAVFRHHPQIARLQLEMELLTRASFEMDALETAESDARSTPDFGKLEIDLHDLVARKLARIRHGHIRAHGLTGSDS